MRKKMHILITRYPLETQLSGEEWHTITLAEKLRARGHRVLFTGSCHILLHELRKRRFITYKSWGGFPVVTKWNVLLFPFFAPFVFIYFIFLCTYLRFRHRLTTVYMQSLNEKLIMTPIARVLGCNVVWVEHARVGRWLLKNPFLFLYKLWSRSVKIISVSHKTAEALSFAPHIQTIVNGVDTEHFSPKNGKKHRALQQHDLAFSHTDRVIGAVARLYPDKGLDYLIQAFAKLLKNDDTLRLCIAGIGPERAALEACAEQLGCSDRVHFLGEVSRAHMPDLYSLFSVFVLPSSLHDPFGLVAAEALSMRVPTVVTNVCGIADDLVHKENAYITEPKSVDSLEQGISFFINHSESAEKIAYHGLKTAREYFSLNRMAEEYERVLKG